MIGTIVGVVLIDVIIKKTGRASIIVIVVGFILILGTALTPTFQIIRII